MEDLIQLEDLISEHPPITDPHIQQKLTAKWEFMELESSATEQPPKKGEYYKHQKLIQRFMLQYPRLMSLHETGTGKSFLIGAVGEVFRKLYEKTHRGIKRVLVVVTGETQEIDMKNMLICRSTNEYYLTPNILLAQTPKSMRTNATKSLNRWYTITRYEKLAKALSNKTDEQIREEYSDHLIILDEIHNLRINHTIDPQEHENPDGKWDKILTYQNIWRLTHLPDRSKVMGLTASLVIDDVNEAGPILNLVLPYEQQFPVGYDFTDPSVTIDDIENYTRGHISYVRALDTGAIEIKAGELFDEEYESRDENGRKHIYKSQVVAVGLEMSDTQAESYVDAFLMAEETNKIGKGLRREARHASKGIYPDGSYGNAIKDKQNGAIVKDKGFNKYIIPDGKWFRAVPEFLHVLEDMDSLAEHNIKAWYTIEEIINKTDGIVVIFDEYVTGSGLIYLALALEAQGFTRFAEGASIFETKSGVAPYCSKRADGERKIRAGFPPSSEKKGIPPRYATIITQTTGPETVNILDTISSYENRYGEYIKVLLISGKATEGISVNNGRAFVQYGGVWNPAKEYQARSRVFRSTSHVDLIDDEVKRLIQDGVDPETARATATVDVTVYKLATLLNEEQVDEFGEANSVDIMMYQYSEAKNRDAKKLMRMLKQVAIDCQIHHTRNIRKTIKQGGLDVDGSPECDFTTCEYDCYDSAPKEIDYSTYDINYSYEAIDKIKERITDFFRFNGMGTLETIHEILDPEGNDHDLRIKYILLALSHMIVNREPILDRYGYRTYIKEDNGLYYLSRSYPLHTNIYQNQTAAFYGKTLIAEKTTKFTETFEKIEQEEAVGLVKKLLEINQNDPEYLDKIRKEIIDTPIDTHSNILEDAINRQLKGTGPKKYVDTIFRIFGNVLFEIKEPIGQIREMARELAENRPSTAKDTKGKKRTPRVEPTRRPTPQVEAGPSTGRRRVTGRTQDVEELGETIYFHTINTHIPGDTKFNLMPNILNVIGTLRIFKPSEQSGWRNMLDYETEVYREIVVNRILEQIAPFEEHDIYGIIPGDYIFRIRNRLEQETKKQLREEEGKKVDDGRNDYTGHMCYTYNSDEIVSFMWHFGGITAYTGRQVRFKPSRDEAIRTLRKEFDNRVEEWPIEKLEFFHRYLISKLHTKKNDLCLTFRQGLSKANLIWYPYINLEMV